MLNDRVCTPNFSNGSLGVKRGRRLRICSQRALEAVFMHSGAVFELELR